jgi:NAD(P)-dependent dehydrogenase (short-subunit alcohol dehydrogenase family)
MRKGEANGAGVPTRHDRRRRKSRRRGYPVRSKEASRGIGIPANNAGISRPQPWGDITEQDWDEVAAVTLKSITGQTVNVKGGWYMS